MQGMTGFSSREIQVRSLGKLNISIKSSNHKFLEIVFHLPENLLFLESKIKKEIESKIRRGRIVCAVSFLESKRLEVELNQPLLRNYISILHAIKKDFGISDSISLGTVIHLPGVFSVRESSISQGVWSDMQTNVKAAVLDLYKMRCKEGSALETFLSRRVAFLKNTVLGIKKRYETAVKAKVLKIRNDDEKAGFLKDADISEEIERLLYHLSSFKSKLTRCVPVGKELDFIAQEMQREANTLGAKSFDTQISSKAVLMKSEIEKIREQVQNIE